MYDHSWLCTYSVETSFGPTYMVLLKGLYTPIILNPRSSPLLWGSLNVCLKFAFSVADLSLRYSVVFGVAAEGIYLFIKYISEPLIAADPEPDPIK